jgi:hypothetical protein
MQLFADLRDSLGDEVAFFMQHADFHGALAAALDLSADSGHEYRSTADGFAVVFFVVKSHIKMIDSGRSSDIGSMHHSPCLPLLLATSAPRPPA